METIRVPQVALVDCSGQSIGVYDDDPGWWQQLKKKHDSNMNGGTSLLDRRNFNNTRVSPIDMMKKEPEPSKSKIKEEEVLNVIGETPLHMAIMYDDLSTIRYLIEKKGYNVNQRCVGGKFTGGFNTKITSKLVQDSQYESLAYYGEYPLALAACFSNKEVYDYLIDQGADPNLPDSNGNTVLHVLVINNKLDMFLYASNHPKKKGLFTIKNNQELTPVNLAAMIGRKNLFEKLLELQKLEIWSWSTTQCSVYPLEGLDTVHSDGTILWNAALSFIVNGETEDHLDMLEIGVVKRLLGDKWATYAQKKFVQKLIFAVVHLILLSIAVYTRASDSPILAKWPVTSATTWVRYVTEAAVVVICIIVLFIQGQEIYAQGFMYYLKNLAGEPANVLYQLFCVLILLAVPFRFIPSFGGSSGITPANVEDTFLILAVPCGWGYLLFFARVFEITGPFVVMIYKMIIGDILTFASIYLLLLFGFALAFYYLYKNAADSAEVTMKDFGEAIMISFQMTVGEFDARLPEFDQIYYSDFTKIVFLAFMVIMHILLLNMLIAMMGNTYQQVIKVSEKEYRKQWSHIVLLIERTFTAPDLRKFQDKYCIKLPSRDPKNPDDLIGLMVIKERPKTKAFISRAAIKNWKKFYKAIFHILKEKNLKSEELIEMWSGDDANTPLKKRSLDIFKKKKKSKDLKEAVKKVNMVNQMSTKSSENNEKKNEIACIAVKEEYNIKPSNILPKFDEKPQSISEPDVYQTRLEIWNEESSRSNKVNTSGQKKKTFYPNQTNRIYSPSRQNRNINDESYIKDDTALPMFATNNVGLTNYNDKEQPNSSDIDETTESL